MAVVLGEPLSSAKFIGHIGGLALALGLGAAAFSGSAVAWADSPADSASHAQHSSAKPAEATAGVHRAAPNAAVRAHTTKVDTPVAAAVAPAMTVGTNSTLGSLAYARRETAVAHSATATTSALVMGPSGVPDPSSTYVTNVNNLYIQPNSPGAVTQVVFTPEGLYPITGVKSLPLNTSVTQGLEMLGQTAGPLLAGAHRSPSSATRRAPSSPRSIRSPKPRCCRSRRTCRSSWSATR